MSASDMFEYNVMMTERHSDNIAGMQGGIHREGEKMRKVVSEACRRCHIHATPYDIRKDNRRWDIHFDSKLSDEQKQKMTDTICGMTGEKHSNINIISLYS